MNRSINVFVSFWGEEELSSLRLFPSWLQGVSDLILVRADALPLCPLHLSAAFPVLQFACQWLNVFLSYFQSSTHSELRGRNTAGKLSFASMTYYFYKKKNSDCFQLQNGMLLSYSLHLKCNRSGLPMCDSSLAQFGECIGHFSAFPCLNSLVST